MPIYNNEGGVLYELDSVPSNEGGTLYNLDTIYANDGGVLYEIFSGGMYKLSWYLYDTTEPKTTLTDFDSDGLYMQFAGAKQTNGRFTNIYECRTEPFTVGSAGIRIGLWLDSLRNSVNPGGTLYVNLISVAADGTETVVSKCTNSGSDAMSAVGVMATSYSEGSAFVKNLNAGKYYLKLWGSSYVVGAYLRVAFGAVTTGKQLSINFDNGSTITSGTSTATISVTTPTAVTFTLTSTASPQSISTPSGTVYVGGGTASCAFGLTEEAATVTCGVATSTGGKSVSESIIFQILLLPNAKYTITLKASPTAPGSASALLDKYVES